MDLTKGQWVTIGAALGAVILTAVLHIGIREWYQPYIRYEEGSWYRSSVSAVASLKVHNMGHSDAEDVYITAAFSEPLRDLATSDPGITFKIIAGGVGDTKVTGVISRLVPDEAVYLYFATKNPSVLNLPSSFLSTIKFKGGKGKTVEPVFTAIVFAILALIVGFLTSIILNKVKFESHYRNLENSIKLGLTLANEGLSEDEVKENLEKEYKKVGFRKRTLIRAGTSSFKAVKSLKSGSS